MDSDSKNQNSTRGKGRGRGRGRKKAVEIEVKAPESSVVHCDERASEPEALTLDLDADITQLEAPTFSTINKGPPEPMLRLNWDYRTHLIGEKVINPFIHCCDKCEAPILIYGRMIPCKHVFCFTCAERESKCCPRCQEKVVRVEKTGLGTVFMCIFGGTRYGNTGCRRTYLSQRDLQAHINHRHVSGGNTNKDIPAPSQTSLNMKPISSSSIRTKPSSSYHSAAVAGDPRVHSSGGNTNNDFFHKVQQSQSSHISSSSQPSRQSHHHSNVSHQPEQHSSSLSGLQHQHQHQHFGPIQTGSSQRHLPATNAQQHMLQTPPDFVNHMMVPTYMSPSSANLTPPANVTATLMNMSPHTDPNATTTFHQTFSPQFSQTSSPGIPPFSVPVPVPVPPPGQPPMNAIPQSAYFSTPMATYPNVPSPQRAPVVPSFSSNSSAQSMLSQPPMIPTSSSTQRRQYPSESVMPPFPVPPPHRWPQPPPNQTHFY